MFSNTKGNEKKGGLFWDVVSIFVYRLWGLKALLYIRKACTEYILSLRLYVPIVHAQFALIIVFCISYCFLEMYSAPP